MIIKKNGELMLLDLNAKGNQHIVNQMGRGEIRDGFLKKGNSYEAMYSIGKTMQFILAKAIIEPKLTKYEAVSYTHLDVYKRQEVRST